MTDGIKRWIRGNFFTKLELFNGALAGVYALLRGRAGGQSLSGGTASGDDLTLDSTTHDTKGTVIIQPDGGATLLGGDLHVVGLNISLGVDSGAGGYTALIVELSAESGGYVSLQGIESSGSAYGDVRLNPSGGDVQVGVGTPNGGASLEVLRGSGGNGALVVRGTDWITHFNHSTGEATYIRGGKTGAAVHVNDAHNGDVTLATGGGSVGVGTSNPNGLQVSATVSETARGVDNVRIGVVSGAPRIILEDATATQWQIDNFSGTLRFFNPGAVKLSLDTSGNLDLTGNLGVSGRVGTVWANLLYGTGWTDFGSGYNPGQYKRVGDLVLLRGLVKRTSGSSGTIATLPAGHRPTAGIVLTIVLTDSAVGRIDISGSGDVVLISGNTSWVQLDGIVFSIL